MAGIIVFRSGDWGVSGGAYRAMAIGVSQHLATSEAAIAVKTALSDSVESQLYFLDVTDSFTSVMLAEFKRGLDLYVREVTNLDPRGLDAPDLHEGFISRLKELQQKVDDSLAAPGTS